VSYTEDNTDTYNFLVGKHERKRPVRRPRCRCENNIKMDFKKVGWAGVNWIHPADCRD
jgi:hypothetical protein